MNETAIEGPIAIRRPGWVNAKKIVDSVREAAISTPVQSNAIRPLQAEKEAVFGVIKETPRRPEQHYGVIKEALHAPRPVTLRDITAEELIDESLQCKLLPCELDECLDNLLALGRYDDPLIKALRHQLKARRTMASLFYLLP